MTKYKNMVGIDLGTTTTCVCHYDPDKRLKYTVLETGSVDRVFPSCVGFTNDGEVAIGRTAKYNCNIEQENIVYAAKRLIGRKKGDKSIDRLFGKTPFKIVYNHKSPFIHIDEHPEGREARDYSPEEISAFVLSEVKNIVKYKTGSYPDACVITVPAYFSEPQRAATKLAAEIAGLNCIKLLSEPTAAALAYKEYAGFESGKVLVFDFGGGTLDVTILEVEGDQCIVLASEGNSELGGEDIDSLLCDEMIKRFVKKNPGCDPTTNTRSMSLLRQKCEEAKKELSSADETKIIIPNFFEGKDLKESITKKNFEFLCDNIISQLSDPIDRAFNTALVDPEDIDQLILVGGSSQIPFVKDTLNNYFEDALEPLHAVPAEEAVATGAAVFFNRTMTEHFNEGDLLENQPISIGIKHNGNKFKKYIEKGKPYPQKNHYDFTPSNPDLDYVKICVYQGEEKVIKIRPTKTHIEIGEFKIKGLPGDGTPVTIGIDMEVDKDGILKIVAKANGREEKLSIDTPSVLSREDIKEAMARLEMKDRMNELSRNYDKLTSEVGSLLFRIKESLSKSDYDKYNNAYKDFIENKPTKENLIKIKISKIEALLKNLKSL